MTSYNTHPILPSAPAEVPPQVDSMEWGLSGTYHLKVVQAKRQGLIDKEKMFKKKYKKYNKISYHCTSQMRSQSQLRNDKYIMMQYTNWINSTPS